jgi:flagellar biosynthesis/type III secretory pathway protein FliH
MSDPVTNALALQMEFSDDELKNEIEQRIRQIAANVVNEVVLHPDFMRRLITNNAYDFNNQVMRAVKEFYQNPRQIY